MTTNVSAPAFKECCASHCRVWQETQDGKYPPSDHAPSCEHYKPERYVTLAIDPRGPKMVCKPSEAEQMIADNEDDPYIVGEVMLTPDQAERLGEFAGF